MIKSHPGVYKIVNTINGNFYVGSSDYSVLDRLRIHFYKLKRKEHANMHLQRAYNKYGESAFIKEVLEECTKEEVLIREQYYIDTLKPQYNMCKIAGSTTGKKHSDETKKKLSEMKKEYFKTNTSYNKGLPMPEEQKKKLSETKKRMFAEGKLVANFKGCKHTPENIQRMSDLAKLRVITEETKKKMSEGQKKRAPFSLEQRQKASIANKKQEMWKVMQTPEAREKIRKALCKKVYQYTRNLLFISEYNSVIEAANQTGLNRVTIGAAANKGKLAVGFIWSYTKLEEVKNDYGICKETGLELKYPEKSKQ